jgi:glycosyltransferase involved in cell wall biosynthesis
MVKVSVLVAVYNAEAYLHHCMDSLLGQTLQDIQILAVDDCSSDSSLSILEQYAEKDNRVEVIHLDENHGQAHARNVALSKAVGEYTCMLDSDDWMSSDALEMAVRQFVSLEDIDTVLFTVCNYAEKGHDEEYYPMDKFTVISGEEAFKRSLSWSIHGIYMIRTSLHKKFPYDDRLKIYSDDNTTRIHYLMSRNVSFCNGIYYYRQHDSSATHNMSTDRMLIMKANQLMKQDLISFHVSSQIIDQYEEQRWLSVVDSYMFYHNNYESLSEDERRYCLNEIKEIWKTIEIKRLRFKMKCKFGYVPCRKSWMLFRIEENLYFFLRDLRQSLKSKNSI